jgi:hypothetical protein
MVARSEYGICCEVHFTFEDHEIFCKFCVYVNVLYGVFSLTYAIEYLERKTVVYAIADVNVSIPLY